MPKPDPQSEPPKPTRVSADGPVVLFSTPSQSVLPADNLPRAALVHLLERNARVPFGAWHLRDVGNGDVGFVLLYRAVGLTAAAFRLVAESMADEAVAPDARLSRSWTEGGAPPGASTP